MTVSAVVISHEQPRDLERCVQLLADEVDEIVAVANTPTSAARLPSDVTVLENQRPSGYATNANAAVGRTSGEFVIVANADVVPRHGAVGTLVSFMSRHEACGIAGPQLIYPDGPPAAFAPRLSDGVRNARSAYAPPQSASPRSTSAATTASTPDPPVPCRPTGCSARSSCCGGP